MLQIPEFKCRCSAIGHIMTGIIGLTEKQQSKLTELQSKEKRTEKQNIELYDLIEKSNCKELSKTAQGYCKDWLKGKILKRKKEVTSMAIEKGNIMEDESIDFIASQLDLGFLLKNEEYFFNDFIEGTPDILIPDIVIDAKNSWSHDTFPLFENELTTNDYFWQMQGYMALTNRSKAFVCYVLSNTPINLIRRQALIYCINQGYESLDDQVYKEFFDKLTYDDIEDNLKIKIFQINRNDEKINQIYERVKICRLYIDELISKMSNKIIEINI